MKWSDSELETLHRMLAENKPRTEIAKALGFARSRVDGRIRLERTTPEQFEATAKRKRAWEARNRLGARPYRDMTISASRPASELIEEARLRSMAPRTITAEFFGDPPKGFSQLDIKRREAGL